MPTKAEVRTVPPAPLGEAEFSHGLQLYPRAATLSQHDARLRKYFASEVAVENALEAMRIHGGMGYSTELDIERICRDAPLMAIGKGRTTSSSSSSPGASRRSHRDRQVIYPTTTTRRTNGEAMSHIGSVAMGDDISGTPDESMDRIDRWGDAGAGYPSIIPITSTERRIARTFAAHV